MRNLRISGADWMTLRMYSSVISSLQKLQNITSFSLLISQQWSQQRKSWLLLLYSLLRYSCLKVPQSLDLKIQSTKQPLFSMMSNRFLQTLKYFLMTYSSAPNQLNSRCCLKYYQRSSLAFMRTSIDRHGGYRFIQILRIIQKWTSIILLFLLFGQQVIECIQYCRLGRKIELEKFFRGYWIIFFFRDFFFMRGREIYGGNIKKIVFFYLNFSSISLFKSINDQIILLYFLIKRQLRILISPSYFPSSCYHITSYYKNQSLEKGMAEFIEEKTEIDLEYQYALNLYNPDEYSNLIIFGGHEQDSCSYEDKRVRYRNYFQEEKASRQTYEEEGSGEKCCGEEVGKERTDYQLLILKIEQFPMIEIESPKDESLREQVLSEVERPENDDSDNYDPVAQEFEQRHQTQPRPKKKGINKSKKRQPAYPTKNFLPTFRGPFLNYLSPHFQGNYFDNLQIVKRIRGKASINMGDYKDLFNVEEFRPLLAEYFSNKTIFRDLFESRISYENKKEYMKRLHVFQTAFTYRKFNQINERRKKASLKG